RQGRTPALVPMANEATTANGLAFSPDATQMYWSDTPAHRIRAWDWDVEANALSRPRVFKDFAGKPKGWDPETPRGYAGRPDGATVDAEGNYWSAMFEGGQVLRFSPSGEQTAALAVPAQCPTMPCFGGDDLNILFVTTSRENRPATELEARPASGQVVAMKVDARGLPVDFFDD
ncbi:MAG: SMP-30/gluconolactonase/LRE family protein, partial [Gammaproteobacteria bacterium]|nr:SMP-30/gluconolactonase/LRE family protein [Gammaproteobacteria bacterium]